MARKKQQRPLKVTLVDRSGPHSERLINEVLEILAGAAQRRASEKRGVQSESGAQTRKGKKDDAA